MKRAKVTLIAVGVVSIVMAASGLSYNLTTVFTDFGEFSQEDDIPYFGPAFYTMSAICVACYIALLVCGVQFVRLRTRLLSLFIGVLVFEAVYFFSLGPMWLIPGIGMSIAAASGVGNVRLVPQLFLLLPLWGPLLATWAARRLERDESSPNQALAAAP